MNVKIKNVKLQGLLVLIFSLIVSIVAHKFFIENQWYHEQYMVGPNDQLQQMQIFKDFMYEQFKEGEFFYSFNYNGGDNYFTRLSYYYSTSLIHYLTMIGTYILEKLNIVNNVNMIYWARLALFLSLFRTTIILLFSAKYINIFTNSVSIALISATFYAFSSMYFRHMVLWEFFSDAFIWLPIILIGVEKIIRGGKGNWFAIGLALTLFNNAYFAYIIVIIVALYIVVRWFYQLSDNEESVKNQILHFLKYGILGFLISLPGFFTFVRGFTQTIRDVAPNRIEWTDFQPINIGKLLLTENMNLIPFIFVIMLLFKPNCQSKSFKFFTFSSLFLLIARYSIKVASVFNGFSDPQFRWQFVIFLLIATAIGIGIKNIYQIVQTDIKLGVKYLLTSGLLTVFIYFIAHTQNIEHPFDIKTVMLFILLQVILFILFSKKLKWISLISVFVLSLNTIYTSNLTLYEQYNLQKVNREYLYNTFDNTGNDYVKSFNKIKEESEGELVRGDYESIHNFGMQQQVPSFNVYNSFQNGYHQQFNQYYKIANFDSGLNKQNGLAGRQVLSSLMLQDYVVTDENNQKIVPIAFEETNRENNLVTYENTMPMAFIHPVHNVYSASQIADVDYKDQLLINGAIIEENKNLVESTIPEALDTINFDDIQIAGSQNGSVIGNVDEENISLTININEATQEYDYFVLDYTIIPIEGKTEDYSYDINGQTIKRISADSKYAHQVFRQQIELPITDSIKIDLPNYTRHKIEIHNLIGVSLDELESRSLSDQSLDYTYNINDSQIEITFNNEQDYPFMVLPIFYDDGWYLEINDEDQEILNTNNGMIGFYIPEGEMTIQLTFKQPYLITSSVISLLAVVFLIFINWRPKNEK